MKKTIIVLIILSVCGLGYYAIRTWYSTRLLRNPAFACGNGRIEATEINIAAKLAGKVEKVKVWEGDKVKAGQVLVVMQLNVLEAELAQAEATLLQRQAEAAKAKAEIEVRTANLNAEKAKCEQAKALAVNSEKNYHRYKGLIKKDATSQQHYDNAEAMWLSNKASYESAKATVKQAEANLLVAKAELQAANANVKAAQAVIQRVKADIDDSILKAPLDGRIQYRIAEPGEVLSAGGRALNMIDYSDVYITFYLPEEQTGKVKLNAEVRIKLDAVPNFAIPARVTYVASVAQFTPKTVETQIERQKLMFRIKAHIDPEKLRNHVDLVRTGLPGVAWVKLDPKAEWPKELMSGQEKGIVKVDAVAKQAVPEKQKAGKK